MAKDIPDFMRGFDLDDDWGMTQFHLHRGKPSVDPKVVEDSKLEISKVKSDVGDIKSMMNEIMQIMADKETVTKTVTDEDTKKRFTDLEKIIFLFCITYRNQ